MKYICITIFLNVRLYTSYGLWLEEPRLQESRIYLPALPPQYDGAKLKNIFEGNEVRMPLLHLLFNFEFMPS
jgi:hypothetical protein